MDEETLQLLRKIREIEEFQAVSELMEAEQGYEEAMASLEEAVEDLELFREQLKDKIEEGVSRSDLILLRRHRARLKEEVEETKQILARERQQLDRAKDERQEAKHQIKQQERLEDKKKKKVKKKKIRRRQRELDDFAGRYANNSQ